MTGPTGDGVHSDRDLNDALDAAHDVAGEYPSQPFRDGFLEGVEFLVRYLRERERLTGDRDSHE